MDYLQAAQQFAETYISDPNVIGVLVAGSHVRGQANPNSDIDLFIILEKSDYRERGNQWTSGFEIEYFINPVEQIRRYFEQEGAKRSTAHMFSEGIIIYEKGELMRQLVYEAQQIAQSPLPPLPDLRIELHKYQLDDLWKDLEDCIASDNLIGKTLTRARLIEECIEVFFSLRRLSHPKPKQLESALSTLDPKFHNFLRQSLSSNRLDSIRELVNYTEKLLGGSRPKNWKLRTALS